MRGGVVEYVLKTKQGRKAGAQSDSTSTLRKQGWGKVKIGRTAGGRSRQSRFPAIGLRSELELLVSELRDVALRNYFDCWPINAGPCIQIAWHDQLVTGHMRYHRVSKALMGMDNHYTWWIRYRLLSEDSKWSIYSP